MKVKVMAALTATVVSLIIGLAWEGSAVASSKTSHGAIVDSCSTWATGSWTDNCEVTVGSISNMVMAVQWIVDGACGGTGIRLDGDFGSNTEHAVECFQNQHGLRPGDGKVGPDTWTALRNNVALHHSNAGWDYYYIKQYQGVNVVAFRKWNASGRWYVIDGSSTNLDWLPMTS